MFFFIRHSQLRAPLTDFNWPWLLPLTADHPRQEDHAKSAGASRHELPEPGAPPSALPAELSGRAEPGAQSKLNVAV